MITSPRRGGTRRAFIPVDRGRQAAVETRKGEHHVHRNGVDTPALFATINAVREHPELAKFTFRAVNRWQQGTHSRTRIQSFYGAGEERMHEKEFVYDADHPAVLLARDQAPTPVEFLPHAIAGCIMSGIGNIAAARGVTLYEV